jgi:hypothetical protein
VFTVARNRWELRWQPLRSVVVVLAIIVGASATLLAQYRATQWTAENGLPQNSVRGIVQAPDGYIWVATLNGVAKFDGIRFKVFDKSNTPGISSSRFTAMVSGAGGDLWLASEDNNVVRYHEGRFTTLGERAGILPRSVGGITTDHRGGVWVDSGGRVLHWNASAQRFEREEFSKDDLNFAPLWWVGTGSGRCGVAICLRSRAGTCNPKPWRRPLVRFSFAGSPWVRMMPFGWARRMHGLDNTRTAR